MANTIGYGQGAVNNTNGWGKAPTNNTIDFGEVCADSWSPETNLTGTATSSFSNTQSTEYDGIDDYVAIANPTNFNDTGDFSISAWVNFTVNSGTAQNVLNIRDDRYLYVQSGKILGAFKNSSGTFYSISTSSTYNDGNWHHVLFVKNNANMILFVDGSQVNINSNGGATRSSGTSYARIGARALTSTPSNYFTGKIDEMAYFTSDESANIGSIYSASGAVDLSTYSPLSWWRFEGSGTTATDSGSGGNDGTLTNGVTRSTDVPT